MSKIKLPTADELFEMLEKELAEEDIALTGDIVLFKKELYKEFRKYVRVNTADEFIVEDYIEDVLYDLVYDDSPHRVTDTFRPPNPEDECA